MDFSSSLIVCFYHQNVLEATHTLFLLSVSRLCVLSHCAAVVRKLQEFELPYVSVTSLRNPDYHIVLRKRYTMTSVCHEACLLATHFTSRFSKSFFQGDVFPLQSKGHAESTLTTVQLWFRKFKKTLFLLNKVMILQYGILNMYFYLYI